MGDSNVDWEYDGILTFRFTGEMLDLGDKAELYFADGSRLVAYRTGFVRWYGGPYGLSKPKVIHHSLTKAGAVRAAMFRLKRRIADKIAKALFGHHVDWNDLNA